MIFVSLFYVFEYYQLGDPSVSKSQSVKEKNSSIDFRAGLIRRGKARESGSVLLGTSVYLASQFNDNGREW